MTEEERERMRELGRKGGKAKVKKGFATMSPEKRRAAARKGRATIKRKENADISAAQDEQQ